MIVSRHLPALAFLLLVLSSFKPHAEGDADELSRQATDPTASLMTLTFQSIHTGGFQPSKVTKHGGQPVCFAINPQYNLQTDRGLTEWSVAFTFTSLFQIS